MILRTELGPEAKIAGDEHYSIVSGSTQAHGEPVDFLFMEANHGLLKGLKLVAVTHA